MIWRQCGKKVKEKRKPFCQEIKTQNKSVEGIWLAAMSAELLQALQEILFA